MAKNKSAGGKVSLPWPDDPPLETFIEILARTGEPVTSVKPRPLPSDPEACLRDRPTGLGTDWSRRSLGTPARVLAVHWNLEFVADTLEQLGNVIESRKAQNRRANDGGVNIVAAVNMTETALLTHLRWHSWHENATLIMLRTALELAVRGGFIALGKKNEAARWTYGPDHKDRRIREAAVALFKNMFDMCKVVAPRLTEREPTCPEPYAVYKWLCGFSHLDNTAIAMHLGGALRPFTHDMAFAVYAYVGRLCAALAEVVTGCPDLAVWPKDWPDPWPWA
jgi:hypothetical protein